MARWIFVLVYQTILNACRERHVSKKLHARVGTKNVPALRLGKYEYAGEVPSAACFNRSLPVSNLHRGIVPSLKFKQQAGTADHLCNHGIGRGLYPVQC